MGSITKKVNNTWVQIYKYGAKTHLTTGGIINVSGSLTLRDRITKQDQLYEKQILIQGNPVGLFASGGDSGALVITSEQAFSGQYNHLAVGLLIGGEDKPPYSYIATPINAVLNALRASLNCKSLHFIAYP
jgi:hypothetical protein